MADISLLYSLLVTIALGFLIGLERNISFNSENAKSFAGSRTFALVSLSGFLSVYLSKYLNFLIYISFIGISLLIVSAYIVKIIKYQKEGSTTHFAAIIAFLIGVLVYYEKNLAVIVTIITVFLLNIKTTIKYLESRLSQKDINSALLLLIMTFVVLPMLPDKMVYYINPYKTWLMAVIIAALSFLGYISIKLAGHKYGILLTGAAGGFISSTAVTLTLSKMYALTKEAASLFTYASAIAIANTIMFARVFVETLLVNPKVTLIISFPYITTTLTGIYYSIKLYKKSSTETKIDIIKLEKNPLELDEAIKFAIIFGVIYSLTYFLSNRYGNIGVYLVSLFSGLTDVDAITLSLSSLSHEKITLITASTGIMLASLTNSLFKLSIVWIFGTKELAKEISKFFGVVLGVFIISGIIAFFIFHQLLQ